MVLIKIIKGKNTGSIMKTTRTTDLLNELSTDDSNIHFKSFITSHADDMSCDNLQDYFNLFFKDHPELLIADEPTTAIAAITQNEILEEFIRIKKQKNTAMLFITHDLGAISKVADRILVMNSGHVVDSGSFDHILKHADDPYTRMLVEKRSAVMHRYRQILHGKESSNA